MSHVTLAQGVLRARHPCVIRMLLLILFDPPSCTLHRLHLLLHSPVLLFHLPCGLVLCYAVGQWFGRGYCQWSSCLVVGFACARVSCNSVLFFLGLRVVSLFVHGLFRLISRSEFASACAVKAHMIHRLSGIERNDDLINLEWSELPDVCPYLVGSRVAKVVSTKKARCFFAKLRAAKTQRKHIATSSTSDSTSETSSSPTTLVE